MRAFLDSYDDDKLEEVDIKKINKIKEEEKLAEWESFDDLDELDREIDKELEEDFIIDYSDSDDNDELYEDSLSELEREILDWNPETPEYRVGFIRNTFHVNGWIGNIHLDKILTDAVIAGASDVHISANQVISFSRNGDIIRMHEYPIPTQEVMSELVHQGLLSQQEQAHFNVELSFNGAYVIQHGPIAKYFNQRTRMNVARTFGNYSIVFRIINDTIPTLEDLAVEEEIINWADNPNGLFLLCGPTGTGKSTTLASVLRNIQQTTRKKIVTIENPIEYIYPDDSESLVVQSEVGIDTLGFYEGLTDAMRQNPDIILLGEVRNTEEVQELLRAAETGHLSISTMHTNSVAATINRIQSLFTGEDQKRIMSTLSDSLRGVANQVLVKDKHDGRFAVRELLTVNEEIRKLILDGDVESIRQYQIKHKKTLEHGLAKAVRAGKCLKSEALKHTSNTQLFEDILSEEVY